MIITHAHWSPRARLSPSQGLLAQLPSDKRAAPPSSLCTAALVLETLEQVRLDKNLAKLVLFCCSVTNHLLSG